MAADWEQRRLSSAANSTVPGVGFRRLPSPCASNRGPFRASLLVCCRVNVRALARPGFQYVRSALRRDRQTKLMNHTQRARVLSFVRSPFRLHQPYEPAGDQPEAISHLVEGIDNGLQYQTLLGVTGSGKTFTMANVIARTGRPRRSLSRPTRR